MSRTARLVLTLSLTLAAALLATLTLRGVWGLWAWAAAGGLALAAGLNAAAYLLEPKRPR